MKFIKLTSLLIIAFAALAGNANADVKVYAASNCKAINDNHNLSYTLTSGWIRNNSNSTVEVVCPIIKDVMAGTRTYVNITLNNDHPGEVECRLISQKADPNAAGFQSDLEFHVTDPNFPDNLRWISFGMNLQTTFSHGKVALYCNLPAKQPASNGNPAKYTIMTQYQVSEYD